MAIDKSRYVQFDELDSLPPVNRDNYLYENNFLIRNLQQNCRLLQVGSMDGKRAISLLSERPDLDFVGLEIEPQLVEIARHNIELAECSASFVAGDITKPPNTLTTYNAVICLNNTLGFVPDYQKALRQMCLYGKDVIVSVFGENFNDERGLEYYRRIGITVHDIQGNSFITENGVIQRFSWEDVSQWGGKIVNTPLGYLTVIQGQRKNN